MITLSKILRNGTPQPSLVAITNQLKRDFSNDVAFNLECISPIDGRYLSNVVQLKEYFSEYALHKYRTKIEVEWVKHLIKKGIAKRDGQSFSLESSQISNTYFIISLKAFLDSIFANFNIESAKRIKEIEKTTNHDVKAVEYYVKEQLSKNDSLLFLKEYVHFSCTSEDINNLSYSLLMSDANKKVVGPTLDQVLGKLNEMAAANSNVAMLCKTHGQPATPSTIGKELANFSYRITRQHNQIRDFRFPGKLNGAVGNFNAHIFAYPEYDWLNVSRDFIEGLSLEFNPYTTQIEPHDRLANYYSYLSLINTILIDFSRDMWGYISLGYFKQKVKKGEIGSSTMPHKVNPIDFENCEGNLGLANSLSHHFMTKLPISRFQRDLSDSTVLRNNGAAIAYSIIAYKSLIKGLGKVEVNKERIYEDLDNHWEILAEPIQTVMRKYNVENAYEKLKELTRGNKITKEDIRTFVSKLTIPEHEKKRMMELEPRTYIGNAAEMCDIKKFI